MTAFTESVVESGALSWLEALGYAVKHGPDIAPGELLSEGAGYGDVVLAGRLRSALARINPKIPEEARKEVIRKMIRFEHPNLIENNRRFHRSLVDGVPVEYRFAALRDTLLSKLMSGEIRARDAEKLAERAV